MPSACLRGGEVMFHLFEGQSAIQLIGILHMRLPLVLYLLSQSFIYLSMDSWIFNLYSAILWYYLIYITAKIITSMVNGSSFNLLLCFFVDILSPWTCVCVCVCVCVCFLWALPLQLIFLYMDLSAIQIISSFHNHVIFKWWQILFLSIYYNSYTFYLFLLPLALN